MQDLTRSLPFLLTLPLVLAACGGGAGADPAPPVATLPERYLLQVTPGEVQDAGAVRAGVLDGASVAVRGVVGGSERPFVEGLAAFTLVDPALSACVGDGMGCATPWDYCCVDPRTIAEQSVTVEFREGAETLAASARGFHGLDHLATIVVQGVAERDADRTGEEGRSLPTAPPARAGAPTVAIWHPGLLHGHTPLGACCEGLPGGLTALLCGQVPEPTPSASATEARRRRRPG